MAARFSVTMQDGRQPDEIELPDRAALDVFLKREPYSRAGLYDPLIVRESRQVVPPPEPGFIEAGLARETAASGPT